MSRPEHSAPPEVFYNESEARKYTTNSRMVNIQVPVSLPVPGLLQLSYIPWAYTPQASPATSLGRLQSASLQSDSFPGALACPEETLTCTPLYPGVVDSACPGAPGAAGRRNSEAAA